MLNEIAYLALPPEMTLGHSNPARWSAMFSVLAQTELADGEFEYLDFVFDPERQAAQARETFLTRLAVGLVVGIVLAVTVFVPAWSWTLRRQVEARTGEVIARDRDLSASEARYALVVAGSDAGIFEWNIGTGVVYRSPRFLSLIGYAEGELPATPEGFFGIVHPDDRNHLKISMNRHLQDRTRHDVEVRIRHKKGHFIWAQITGQAAWNEQGEPINLAGSVIEITKRKNAETALRSSEERFALAVVGTDAGLWDWNPNTGASYRSPRWHEMLGYVPAELLATSDAFYEMIHPKDLEKFRSAMKAHIDDRVLFDIEIRVRHKNGHYVWVHERGQAVWDENGNVQRMVGSITDISSRLEARRALQKSERRFRGLFENAEISIWNEDISALREALTRLRQDGIDDLREHLNDNNKLVWELAALVKVRQVNEATLDLFGAKSEAEMLGRIESTFGSDAIEVFNDVLLAHWNGDPVFRAEANFKKLDGAEFPAIMTFRIPETPEEFHSVPVSIIDITERRRAEEELRRYEVIVASSSDMIALVDKNFTYLAANQAYLRPFGKTHDQVIGIFAKALLDDKLFKERMEPNFQRLLAVDEIHYQDWLTFGNGVRAHLDVRYSPYVGATGEILGMVIIARDISEHILVAGRLDAATERLAAIIDQAGEAIITIDENQDIQLFNQAAADLFGYSRESAISLNLDDLIPVLHRDAHRDHVRKFLGPSDDHRLMNVPGEISGLRRDGSKFPAEATISSFVSNGEKLGTVMIRDISDRVQWENRLRAASNEAQLANRAKTEFLANTSHELRAPMNAIIGFTELLIAGIPGEPTKQQLEYFNDIHGSFLHLLGVINDILDISKIESDVLNLNESEVEIPTVVESSIRILAERADRGGLTMLNQVSDSIPWLRADPRILKQILINLLSNAVKFTEPGGKITIGAHVIDDGSMEIWVSDTGIGMDEKDIAKALTVFGQVDGDLNRNFEGTGLGLPLVKSQLEAHGGILNIASTPGTGTTMTIRFPADRTIVTGPESVAANA